MLISVLGDDRGRIAIYALRRAVLEMPAQKAADILAKVPLLKVTIAKEVLRLFGELPTKVALPSLQNFAAQKLHPDVRTALLRALWSHLEAEESWRILEQAAEEQDLAMASVLIRIPSERLSEFSQKRLIQLFGKILCNPDGKIRIDLMNRCLSLPVLDQKRILFQEILSRVDSSLPDERKVASQAVIALLLPRDIPTLIGKISLLLTERKNRRALVQIIESYKIVFFQEKKRLGEVLAPLLQVLSQDPLTLPYQIELWIYGCSVTQLISLFEQNLPLLHEEALHCALATLIQSGNWRGISELQNLEDRLRKHPDEKLRRLGLAALLALTQPPRAWDAEKLEKLQQYRMDPSPLVATAAQFTLPIEEEILVRKEEVK